MAEIYYPFATGAGANANEAAWLNIFLAMGRPGVLIGEGTEFNVTATGGTVTVGTGKAHCFGHYFELDATSAPITVPANAGGTRYDRVVIRFDFAGDNAHAVLLQGSTSAAATLSASRNGFYDLPIAVLNVPNPASGTTVTMAKDRWAMPMNSFPAGTLLPLLSGEATIPKYAVIPNGQVLKRFEYERLWNLWDTTGLGITAPRAYGRVVTGSGATPGLDTLKTPDMRGRSFFGLDTEGAGGDPARIDAADILGNEIGNNIITINDMAPHHHLFRNHATAPQFIWAVIGPTIHRLSNATGTGDWVEVSTMDSIYNTLGIPIPSGASTDDVPLGPQNTDSRVPPAMLGNWMMLV